MHRLIPALLLFFLVAPLDAQVKITQGSDRIIIEIDGQPFTEMFTGSGVTKPYLHPLRSASGKIVTRRFPMEVVEGEAHDHPHHRGLWFAHGDVNGFDYWSLGSTRQGPQPKIEIRRVTALESGKKQGIVRTLFDWVDRDGKALLTEDRLMTFYSHLTQRTIDFDIALAALQPVKFGDTKEGTFAIRLAPQLELPSPKAPATPKRNGHIVTSEGVTGDKVWGTRAKWVDYYGEIEGEQLGIAVFDHPTNPRHPTYWHARGYGLFAANIFGVHDFLNDKNQDGSMSLAPGQSLRFRYRVIIHPDDPQKAQIPGQYEQYAKVKFK